MENEIAVDPGSPVPVFHQIAEAVKYRIATGQLRPGDRLPSIRTFAEESGIHYLTVRKAYAALEADGLVTARRGVGTTVVDLPHAAPAQPPELRTFVDATIRRARAQYGVTPARLAAAIEAAGSASVPAAPALVHFVECSRAQSEDYAAQLSRQLGIPVAARVLQDEVELPSGLLVSTYFHFNEIRSRWPARSADTHFVAVELDTRLKLPGAGAPSANPRRLRVLETDGERIHNVLPDLAALFPSEDFLLEPHVAERVEDLLRDDDPAPVLLAPRLLAGLNPADRADPRLVELRYVITRADVERLRARLVGIASSGSRGAA